MLSSPQIRKAVVEHHFRHGLPGREDPLAMHHGARPCVNANTGNVSVQGYVR